MRLGQGPVFPLLPIITVRAAVPPLSLVSTAGGGVVHAVLALSAPARCIQDHTARATRGSGRRSLRGRIRVSARARVGGDELHVARPCRRVTPPLVDQVSEHLVLRGHERPVEQLLVGVRPGLVRVGRDGHIQQRGHVLGALHAGLHAVQDVRHREAANLDRGGCGGRGDERRHPAIHVVPAPEARHPLAVGVKGDVAGGDERAHQVVLVSEAVHRLRLPHGEHARHRHVREVAAALVRVWRQVRVQEVAQQAAQAAARAVAAAVGGKREQRLRGLVHVQPARVRRDGQRARGRARHLERLRVAGRGKDTQAPQLPQHAQVVAVQEAAR
mmetsp:Transcript_25645/g.65114  ORF Transcript_25645/g.65114 Transcript_25645/m.65114 type:complete len:329 (+) Transcript_25645:472-1458(+)